MRLTRAGRLDAVLSKELSVSRTLIAWNIENGQVTLNEQVVTKPAQADTEGDTVRLHIIDPPPTNINPCAGSLDIIYEDEALIAINKPQGLVVHPAPSTRENTLVHFLLHHLRANPEFKSMSQFRPGIVHRLDRGTSGVILVAKTRAILDNIAKQFKDRSVDKCYECIVWGSPPSSGSYSQSIGRDTIDRKRMSLKSRQSRTALTHWKVIARLTHFTHLEVHPKTGRTHQIRVHLSSGGFPILGDTLYRRAGIERRTPLPSALSQKIEGLKHTFLHARSLTLLHPLSYQPLTLSADRPPVFDKWLKLLRSDWGD